MNFVLSFLQTLHCSLYWKYKKLFFAIWGLCWYNLTWDSHLNSLVTSHTCQPCRASCARCHSSGGSRSGLNPSSRSRRSRRSRRRASRWKKTILFWKPLETWNRRLLRQHALATSWNLENHTSMPFALASACAPKHWARWINVCFHHTSANNPMSDIHWRLKPLSHCWTLELLLQKVQPVGI